MTAPDSTSYTRRGETDDPPLQHLVSTHTDATHPAPVPTLKAAENAVLFHIQAWWDADGELDIRVAHACAVADLGQWTPTTGFAQLAWDYHNPMTAQAADQWTARLTQYLKPYQWKERP